MSKPRKTVPAALKRKLFEEAGYRCGVATCNATSGLEMEHIKPWSLTEKHRFDNMIILCAVCHSRVTNGEIDKSAIRAYKRNLSVANGRYTKFEMRLVERYWRMGLQLNANGSALVIKEIDGLSSPSFAFSDADMLHVDGLLQDQLIYIIPVPLKAIKTSLNLSIPLDNNDRTSQVMAKSLGLSRYMVCPTTNMVEFINDYFSGREIE